MTDNTFILDAGLNYVYAIPDCRTLRDAKRRIAGINSYFAQHGKAPGRRDFGAAAKTAITVTSSMSIATPAWDSWEDIRPAVLKCATQS